MSERPTNQGCRHHHVLQSLLATVDSVKRGTSVVITRKALRIRWHCDSDQE